MTLEQVEKLVKDGKIKSYTIDKKGFKPVKEVKPDPKGLAHIKSMLNTLNIPYETEYKFCKTRKFRADIAVLQYRLIIEYDGLFSAKSRHTTVTGFTNDHRKFNIATIEGWSVLKYTALNHAEFDNDIIQFLLKFN